MILRVIAAVILAGMLSGCQAPPPPTRADAVARADCRQQVERQYNAQNRADLTRRDERDYAFAGTYNAGISSRGLGAEFQRDQMESDCLRASGASQGTPAPGVGPALTPIGPGSSSLRP